MKRDQLSRVSVTLNGEEKAALFSPKEKDRIVGLLEVAGQSTDSVRDSDLLDKLARLFS